MWGNRINLKALSHSLCTKGEMLKLRVGTKKSDAVCCEQDAQAQLANLAADFASLAHS